MPTVEDLHAAFAELERRAPSACHAESQTEAEIWPRRRRVLLPVLAAAVVLVIAAAAALIAVRGTQHDRAAAPTRITSLSTTDYSFSFGALPNGLVAEYAGVEADTQGATVWDATGQLAAVVDVSGQSPSRSADPVDATVSGQPAQWGTFDPMKGPPFSGNASHILLWQDRTGLWVSVLAFTQPLSEVTQIAEAIEVGSTEPVRVPVKLGGLPGGLDVTSVNVGRTIDAEPDEGAVIPLADRDDGRSYLTIEVWTMATTIPSGAFASLPDPAVPMTAGRFTGSFYPNSNHAVLTDGRIRVVISDPNEIGKPITDPTHPSEAEFKAILEHSTFAASASMADVSTWFDAATALPH